MYTKIFGYNYQLQLLGTSRQNYLAYEVRKGRNVSLSVLSDYIYMFQQLYSKKLNQKF